MTLATLCALLEKSEVALEAAFVQRKADLEWEKYPLDKDPLLAQLIATLDEIRKAPK
jgi:hypothetical protein